METNTSILPLSERNDDVLPNIQDRSKTFRQFKLHPLLIKSLEKLKYQYPSPVQHLSLPHGLCGKDMLIQAKSGTGKTVTFGLILLQDFLDSSSNKYIDISHHLQDKNSCIEIHKNSFEAADPTHIESDSVDSNLSSTLQHLLPTFQQSLPHQQRLVDTSKENNKNLSSIDNELNTSYLPLNETHELHSIVISPTRELAIQIADEIQRLGWYIQPRFRCVCLVGGVSGKEDRAKISKRPNLVVATPGRIFGAIRRFRWMKSQKKKCKVFVLDEADLLLSHSFRSIIEFLMEYFISSQTQILAVSATFPPPYVNYLEETIAKLNSRKNNKQKDTPKPSKETGSSAFTNIFDRAMKYNSNSSTQQGTKERRKIELSDNDSDEAKQFTAPRAAENQTNIVTTQLIDNTNDKDNNTERKFVKVVLSASHKISQNHPETKNGITPEAMQTLSPILKGLKFCCITIQDQPNELRERIVKLETLSEIFKLLYFQQAILFSNNPIEGMQLAQSFTKMGIPSEYSSSYLSQSDRVESFSSLKSGRCKLLVCSDVMSRGVDAIQVDLVINWDIPMDKETFIHRFGRAGRFGLSGYNISVCTQSDFPYFNYFFKCFDIEISNYHQFIDHLNGINNKNCTSREINTDINENTLKEYQNSTLQSIKLILPHIPILGIMTSSHCCTFMNTSFHSYLSIEGNNSANPNSNEYYLEIYMFEKKEMDPNGNNGRICFDQTNNTNKSIKHKCDQLCDFESSRSLATSRRTCIIDSPYEKLPKIMQDNQSSCKESLLLHEQNLPSINAKNSSFENNWFHQDKLNYTESPNNGIKPESYNLIKHSTTFSETLSNPPYCFRFKAAGSDLNFIYIHLENSSIITMPLYAPFTQQLYSTSTSYLILYLDRDIAQYFDQKSNFEANYGHNLYQLSIWQVFLDKLSEDLKYEFEFENSKASDYNDALQKIIESPKNQLKKLKDLHSLIWSS